jgi:hypothetical protein
MENTLTQQHPRPFFYLTSDFLMRQKDMLEQRIITGENKDSDIDLYVEIQLELAQRPLLDYQLDPRD